MKSQNRTALSARILKVAGIFSSLQMLSIVCAVIKAKIVALWLGTTGVGLFGIYQSVVDTLSTFTDMGIRQSAVRDVAAATKEPSRLQRIISTVRALSALSALIGAALMAALSIPLGYWFFGTIHGAWGFLVLSVAMLLNALSGGEQAILQGSGSLRSLAAANLWGTLCGLGASIPLFYWLGEYGVPLSVVAYALALFTALYLRRTHTPVATATMSLRELWQSGGSMVRLGISMAMAAFITSLAHTLFVAILSALSSTSEVGLMQAGDTLVNRYIGMLFVAIGVEYYPRLASVAHHRKALRVYATHELSLLLLILTPCLCLLCCIAPYVIELLYSSDFKAATPLVIWGALSSIPKALSWCMAYIIVARGDGRMYIVTESIDAVVSLSLCTLGWYCGGLTGLGVAYIAWYGVYALITCLVCRYRYRVSLPARGYILTATAMGVCTLIAVACFFLPVWLTIVATSLVAVVCVKSLIRYYR